MSNSSLPTSTEPGLDEFLKDQSLSADATPEEIEFLKSLKFKTRRPSPLYFYRELQNPGAAHFLAEARPPQIPTRPAGVYVLWRALGQDGLSPPIRAKPGARLSDDIQSSDRRFRGWTTCPTQVGIATFTTGSVEAGQHAHPQSQCFAVSVNDIKGGYDYPEVVRFEIEEQDLSSCASAQPFLNISNVDVVCLQHEFGIFGGPAGGHILAFLRELRMPIVTTLYTSCFNPRPDQRRVMRELISHSTRLVVMAEYSRRITASMRYTRPISPPVDVIAHSIPDVGFVRIHLL